MSNLVDSRIDSVFSLVTEYSFLFVDSPSLTNFDRSQIFRKVCLIREHLEECKTLWAEVESLFIS